jgi:hypothetical protein
MTTTALLLLALFGIKHFVADFWLQTSKMVAEKGIYGKQGGIDHSAIHGAFAMWIVYFVTKDYTIAVITGGIDFLLHYHIDWLKQKVNRGRTYTDKMWWFYMGLDQCLHYLTYIGIIYYVTAC